MLRADFRGRLTKKMQKCAPCHSIVKFKAYTIPVNSMKNPSVNLTLNNGLDVNIVIPKSYKINELIAI